MIINGKSHTFKKRGSAYNGMTGIVEYNGGRYYHLLCETNTLAAIRINYFQFILIKVLTISKVFLNIAVSKSIQHEKRNLSESS